MLDGQTNYLAIVAVAIINNILGAIWYSSKVFGKSWAKACKIEMGKKKAGAKHFLGGLLMSLIMAAAVSCLVIKLDLTMVSEGIKLGILLWLGFIATSQFCGVIWAKKPLKVYLIDAGFYLASLLIMGAILATWRL